MYVHCRCSHIATINTFNEFREQLDMFYSNSYVETRNRRQCNLSTSNFVLKRKKGESKFKTEDEAQGHRFIKVVGFMFSSVWIIEK